MDRNRTGLVGARRPVRPGFRQPLGEALGPYRAEDLYGASFKRCCACAASAVLAARTGRFGAAWRELPAAYETLGLWPEACREDPGEAECPAGSVLRRATFPEALRRFRADKGYLSAGAAP